MQFKHVVLFRGDTGSVIRFDLDKPMTVPQIGCWFEKEGHKYPGFIVQGAA